MDVVRKVVAATENLVATQTQLKKLDFSLLFDANNFPDISSSFTVAPMALNQVAGGVGFLFFMQAFRISLFDKYYKREAREKVFELHEKLELIFQKLYDLRVTGNDYQMVNLGGIQTLEPVIADTFVRLDLDFSIHYRRTNVFGGG